MKKFKFRFSYFLILGIIGIIFQIVSFFTWSNIEVTKAQLITSSSTEYFDLFVKPNYFVIVSAIFLIAFAVGLIICSKKEQLVIKVGGYTLGLSQLIVSVVTIIYLIYATEHRVDLFNEDEIIAYVNTLVNIKYIATILTYVGLASVGLGLVMNKANEKITKTGGFVGLVINELVFVVLITTLIGGSFSMSYDFLNKFVAMGTIPTSEFELVVGSMNGFTYSHLSILVNFDQIITSYGDVYKALRPGVVLSIITSIIYLVSMVGNLVFLALTTIQSFDINKDERPMEI